MDIKPLELVELKPWMSRKKYHRYHKCINLKDDIEEINPKG